MLEELHSPLTATPYSPLPTPYSPLPTPHSPLPAPSLPLLTTHQVRANPYLLEELLGFAAVDALAT